MYHVVRIMFKSLCLPIDPLGSGQLSKGFMVHLGFHADGDIIRIVSESLFVLVFAYLHRLHDFKSS